MRSFEFGSLLQSGVIDRNIHGAERHSLWRRMALPLPRKSIIPERFGVIPSLSSVPHKGMRPILFVSLEIAFLGKAATRDRHTPRAGIWVQREVLAVI